MDVPYPHYPCAAHQSGKMQEVPEDYADSHLRASLYFSHDTLRYAAYLPFSLRRACKCHRSGIRGAGGGKLHRFGFRVQDDIHFIEHLAGRRMGDYHLSCDALQRGRIPA